MTRPYKSTAAERISLTEARLGRKVWSPKDLPDDLSRALWWKQRRWYFDDLRNGLAEDDPAILAADGEYYEAEAKHALLIREMWLRRMLALEEKAWAALASVGTAMTEPVQTMRSDERMGA